MLNKINTKQIATRHVILEVQKTKGKENISKGDWNRKICTRGVMIQIMVDFLLETRKARKQWNKSVKVLKKKSVSTQNSIARKNILQKWMHKTHFQTKKSWELLSAANLYLNVKKNKWREMILDRNLVLQERINGTVNSM